MLVVIPPTRHGPRRRPAPLAPAPVALTLIEAIYQQSAWVRLTFDRAVKITSVNPAVVHINDNIYTDQAFVGTGLAALITPQTVQINLAVSGSALGSGIALTASAASGIAAVDDGGTWAGVTAFALPFPA
jgi:hypothetical protein